MLQKQVVIFRARNKNVQPNKQITFNSTPLEIVPTFRSLGVLFNELMSWNGHLSHVISKLSQVIGVLFRNQHVLPSGTMKLFILTQNSPTDEVTAALCSFSPVTSGHLTFFQKRIRLSLMLQLKHKLCKFFMHSVYYPE